MSAYKIGKDKITAWREHWSAVADTAYSKTSTIAKMAEYGQVIKGSFHPQSDKPEILMRVAPEHIRWTHEIVRHLPIRQRTAIWVWSFGDDDERIDLFGQVTREPEIVRAVYKRVGRRFFNKRG